MDIFITAAPVGALLRYIDQKSIKYLPLAFVQAVPGLEEALKNNVGWEKVSSDSLVISESTKILLHSEFIQNIVKTAEENIKLFRQEGLINEGGTLQYHALEIHPHRILLEELFSKITFRKLVSQLVLHLTSQGWRSRRGGLHWDDYGFMEPYISPNIVEQLRSTAEGAFEDFLEAGWRIVGPGYVLLTRGASSFVPITPKPIIAESVAAALEGAAIIHLHTRKMPDESTWELPWSTSPLTLASQANQIVPADYGTIVPELRYKAPLAILNLSTSMRGGGDSESSLRQEHLKPYGANDLAP
jgi:beta-keto acid cleavage enzyme